MEVRLIWRDEFGKLFRVHGVTTLPTARRSETSAPGKGVCDTWMLTEPQSSYRPHKMQEDPCG